MLETTFVLYNYYLYKLSLLLNPPFSRDNNKVVEEIKVSKHLYQLKGEILLEIEKRVTEGEETIQGQLEILKELIDEERGELITKIKTSCQDLSEQYKNLVDTVIEQLAPPQGVLEVAISNLTQESKRQGSAIVENLEKASEKISNCEVKIDRIEAALKHEVSSVNDKIANVSQKVTNMSEITMLIAAHLNIEIPSTLSRD